MNSTAQIAVAIGLPLIGGFAGGMLTKREIKSWYQHVIKPKATPPNWIFGPMWTSLYIGMGYASYLVYGSVQSLSATPMKWYFGQMILNWAWTPLFFYLHQPGLALINISCMEMAIIKTSLEFGKVNRAAGLLLVPYIVWVGYASFLNAYVWWNYPESKKRLALAAKEEKKSK